LYKATKFLIDVTRLSSELRKTLSVDRSVRRSIF